MAFTLLPAVDVADGRAVRLVQGEAGTETTHGDPRDAALAWQADGAEWIHLVDLDAAFGRGSNAELLAAVIGELDVEVQLSGGIRDDASLERALSTGCARVNLGTAALEDPAWCARAIAAHGERVAVGLDVRVVEDPDGSAQHRLAARGGTARRRRPVGDPRAARPGRLRPLRRHRREQGRHAARPERRALPGGHPRHHGPGDRLRRDLLDRRPGRPGRGRRGGREPGGRRSSARRSTPAGSPCPRRWRRCGGSTPPHERRVDRRPRRIQASVAALGPGGADRADRHAR